MADPRPYWNDPEAKRIALNLIAHSGEAVALMKAAGFGSDAIIDTLMGTVAYIIASNTPEGADEEAVNEVIWALVGKLKGAREKLPEIKSTMSILGNA